MKELFIIRHGQSSSNVGINKLENLPDSRVYLTNVGQIDAQNAAICLKDYFYQNKISEQKVRLFVSPYKRTMQTSQLFKDIMKFGDIVVDARLVEQQYGIVNGDYLPHLGKSIYLEEAIAFYRHSINNGAGFYARPPMGESEFEIDMRIKSFLSSAKMNDLTPYGVVITHSITMRVMMMELAGREPYFVEECPEPPNCSIFHFVNESGKWSFVKCLNYNVSEIEAYV